jgi:hypothetical protein
MQQRGTGHARAARRAAGVLASSRASRTPRSRRAAPPPPLQTLFPTERAPAMCNRSAASYTFARRARPPLASPPLGRSLVLRRAFFMLSSRASSREAAIAPASMASVS